MLEKSLTALAKQAGIAVRWQDAAGAAKIVTPEVLRQILSALEYPAANARQIADSRARLRQAKAALPPLIVVRAGRAMPAPGGRVLRLIDEEERPHDIRINNGKAVAPSQPGYYHDAASGQRYAVTPKTAFSLADISPGRRIWGVAAQLYALRGRGEFGDFASLADFAAEAGMSGADMVAISPVHALFGARPRHISPYSPSTRLFLNPVYAALDKPARRAGAKLIDWRHASTRKFAALKADYQAFRRRRDCQAFDAFVREGGARLLAHARFEVLDRKFRAEGFGSWRDWPAAFRDPHGAAVRKLRADDPEVAFQLFLQWRADAGLAAAQKKARDAGMAVGLITDMAVGMDPAGSHAWSAPSEVLRGLSVGAPPDIYNQKGQNWGLTNFSSIGLEAGGFEGFIGTLRAAMRHAGGIRLDHAMGLQRLWLVPDGAGAGEGAYLHYPIDEMLGLLALESRRHRALVIAEDLGTVPDGFRERIGAARLSGMRVFWFERDAKGVMLPPAQWDRHGAALSTTHDLPTLAGWWSGHDLAWRARTGIDRKTVAAERAARIRDRRMLWKAMRAAGCAVGAMPKPGAPARFVDAAFAFLAKTPCPLALLPVEDFVGAKEQPNIPGTIDEHPNWRRRLADAHPFKTRSAIRRAGLLNKERP